MTNRLNKKNTRKMMKKGASLLAAAILSTALLSGQAALAYDSAEVGIESDESHSLIPENVTIEDPVALSEIVLPQLEVGILTWVDEDFVPYKHVQKCEVELEPAEGEDLSYLEGWDEEKGVVVGHITVVVNSIQADSSDETEEAESEETGNDSETGSGETDNKENEAEDSEAADKENGETPSESEGEQKPAEGEKPEEGQETENPEDTDASGKTEDTENTETPDASEDTENNETPETPKDTENKEIPEDAESQDPSELPENGTDMGLDGGITGGDFELELPETPSENPDAPAEDQNDQEIPDNIFDRPIGVTKEDTRPVTFAEDLSQEEMDSIGEENHTFAGISVSGINLPWYVQFRVSSGEEYQFTNESDAAIFQSYEFELWDLQNNVEYEIPDGEYISVTVPVKEGYDYTIEHLLDTGAMETIIPSVEGSTMIFSTHSFSPFGIAGSKPIVGSDLAEDGYSDDSREPSNAGVAGQDKEETGSGSAVTDKKDNAADNKNNTDNTNNKDNNRKPNPDTQNDQQKSMSSNSVNTGDDTPILPFVILVGAAVLVIAVVIVMKKKSK